MMQPAGAMQRLATAQSIAVPGLWVMHWRKRGGTSVISEADAERLKQTGVYMDTCLRQIAFGLGQRPSIDAYCGPGDSPGGRNAYQLLLEVATGLRSAIPGETNIFGQFKRAWQTSADALGEDARRRLIPLVEALLADTRTIRRENLQDIGGASYGSLVRRLLSPARDARVLFVGTGELARSMLPLFSTMKTGAWNHRPASRPEGVDHWFAPEDAASAASWAEHVVLTTPHDVSHDEGWRTHLEGSAVCSLVHLGRRRADPRRPWRRSPTR